MYAYLFNELLPGPLWLRIFVSITIVALVLWGLMEVVFPWASEHSPFGDSVMDEPS